MNPLDRILPMDQWTRRADQAVGILSLKDPRRTSVGIVIGSCLSFLSTLLEPLLQTVTFANFAALSWWSWFAPGILIMHVPTIRYLFKQPSVGHHAMDVYFAAIDRGDFSPAEKRQLYRRLIERFADLAAADHTLNDRERTAGQTPAEPAG